MEIELAKTIVGEVEAMLPVTFTHLWVGLLAAMSRLAYDSQTCDRGWRGFVLVFGRQFVLAFTFVVVGHGITTYYKFPHPISVSIILLAGFFVREIIDQIKVMIQKIPCLILRFKGKKK